MPSGPTSRLCPTGSQTTVVDAEVVAQPLLDLVAGQVRVPVRVEEALLGRDQRALPVHEERAAFEHERRAEQAHPEVGGDPLGEPGVVDVRMPAVAPGVETELDGGDEPGRVADEAGPLSRP